MVLSALPAYLFFCVCRNKQKMEELNRQIEQNPYTEINPEFWSYRIIERSFSANALGGFLVPYQLTLEVARVDDAEFKRSEMLKKSALEHLVDYYDRSYFQQSLRDKGFFFVIELRVAQARKEPAYIARPKLCCLDGLETIDFKPVLQMQVVKAISEQPRYTENGCSVTLSLFIKLDLDHHFINQNYAMITEEQKQEIESMEMYAIIESRLAIMALKRQQDILGNKAQKFEASFYKVEIEKNGSTLKITWEFKESSPVGYDLYGFRKRGGFNADEWDMQNNGMLVVHSRRAGEVTEILPDNEAQFYTFFLRGKDAEGKIWSRDPLRFQIQVSGKEELNKIAALIERLENKPNEKSGISKSLEELNLAMEFHEEMDKMEQSFIERIKSKKLSEEEKEEKVEFIRDMVRLQREKYEP